MKKKLILGATFLLMLLFFLVGCGGEKPESVVENYLECMKKNDSKGMGKYVLGNEGSDETEDASEEEEGNFIFNALMPFVEENASQIKYSIEKSEVTGENATVSVKVTYNNAAPIFKLAYQDFMSAMLASAFSDVELNDDDDMEALFLGSFETKKDETAILQKEETIKVALVKKDGKWLIEDTDPFLNVFLCNMMEAMEGLMEDDEDTASQENSDEDATNQESESEKMQEAVTAFVGDWTDSNSERAHLQIKDLGDGAVSAEINWSNSSDAYSTWTMSGKCTYDNLIEEWVISYDDCKEVDYYYDYDEDTPVEEVAYENGGGYLYINSDDGFLNWEDENFDSSSECWFAKDE